MGIPAVHGREHVNTKPGDLRQVALPGSLLATLGVVLTAGGLGSGAFLLLDVRPMTAFLKGAVVTSTGLFVGAKVPLHRRGIRTFHQGLASIAQAACS